MIMTLPGTTLYKKAESDGIITQENALKARSDVEVPDILYSELTPKELISYSKYAFRKFYFRPKYIFKTALKFISIVRIQIIFKEFLYILRKYTI